jgi:tetratricopeptide (TPR) repeat protein
MRRATASWAGAALLGLALGWSSAARAASPAPSAEDLARVEAALGKGAFSEAIAQLEQWSDQGFVHPDASFDRGVAYLGRAESTARRAGDFGQAVAAFEEARYLDPSDEEAAVILERIRQDLGERRAKHDADGVVARPRLLRAVLDLIGEDVWAVVGAIGATSLGAGLAARLWARAQAARLAGAIAAVVGLGLALLGAGLALAGQRLRTSTTPAVVVAEEARLENESGKPLRASRGASTLGEASDRAPEGTLVHVAETRGSRLRVEWGDADAWLEARHVRRLAPQP